MRLKKSTVIIFLLLGYILWSHLALAATIKPSWNSVTVMTTDTPTTTVESRFQGDFNKGGLSVSNPSLDFFTIQKQVSDKKAADKAEAQAAQEAAQQAQIQEEAVTPPQEQSAVVAPVYTPPASVFGCVTYWSGDVYLDNIIRFESSGNSCATNAGDCFGLLQACPGAPLRDACGGNPDCQIAWFIANKTHGRTWAEVWQHEIVYGWW